jgi:hypothetical protein
MGILKAPLDLWNFEIITSQDMPKLRAEDEDEKGKKTTGNWEKQGLASLEKGKKNEEVTEKNAERAIGCHKAKFGCPICDYTVCTVDRVGQQASTQHFKIDCRQSHLKSIQ